MPIAKVANTAKKTYIKGARLAGNTVNGFFMRPGTRVLTSVTNKVPVVGRPLTKVARMPRRVTRGATSMIIAIPTAAGRATKTGVVALSRALFDPLLATGLLPSGTTKRLTKKPRAKSTRKRR